MQVQVDTTVSILRMGTKFSYCVPSFSVIHVDLRQNKFQLLSEEGTVFGYIRADPSLSTKTVPFFLQLKDYCFVCVCVCVIQSIKFAFLC